MIPNGGMVEEIATAPKDIPVYICNWNRVTPIKAMVEWLLDAGTRRITIVDNASTFPLVARFYAALPSGVTVHQLGANKGPWETWRWVDSVCDTAYVYTDSDIVPADFCPKDLIEKCVETFNENPNGGIPHCGKVGPSLRIDNAPESVQRAEAKYWAAKVDKEEITRVWGAAKSESWVYATTPCYKASIDTTFALYYPHSPFNNSWSNMRLAPPYSVEHIPWYAKHAHKSSFEEAYLKSRPHVVGTGHYR